MLVKNNYGAIHAGDLRPGVKVKGRNITVDGMLLPILVHDNEHASHFDHLPRGCLGWRGLARTYQNAPRCVSQIQTTKGLQRK